MTEKDGTEDKALSRAQADEAERLRFSEIAARTAARMNEVDWQQAWRQATASEAAQPSQHAPRTQ